MSAHELEASDQSSVAVHDLSALDVLSRLRGKSEPAFLDRIIVMFIESASTLLRELNRARSENDVAALHHASHALKSCSATIGAGLLAERCGELETAARRGSVPDAASQIDVIVCEYQRVEAALISRLAPPPQKPLRA